MSQSVRTERLDDRLYRTVAHNGVTVLSEALPSVRSTAIGFWVRRASVHELPGQMGISHLLEHMVFKGTNRRTARDIALALESRGGALDAFTSRDHTAYQARVLDEDLPRAVDVLTDLIREPALRQSDLDLERKVVLEEISTVEDTPDDLVFDLHAQALWPDHPYGFSILGTRASVAAVTAEDLQALHQASYHPRQVVIAAAGSLEHEALLTLLGKYGWFAFAPGPDAAVVGPVPAAERGEQRVVRQSQQTHIVIGTDTFPYRDRRRLPMVLLTTMLGGGMSSRLFQRVREELGLAYAIYAFQSFYRETGVAGVYVGTQPATAEQAADVIRQELATVAQSGLSADELAEAKQQVKGQVTLSMESTTARMYRLAGSALNDEPYRTLDETLRELDDVTVSQVADVAAEYFDPARQTAVWLGPEAG